MTPLLLAGDAGAPGLLPLARELAAQWFGLAPGVHRLAFAHGRVLLTLAVVDESRPERPTHSGLILVMVAAVVGTGALLGSALLLGAFDSRVHEPDDVARLGLPMLGHVPGFAGDNVGSMRTRSAAPSRVPSFQRWRFLR